VEKKISENSWIKQNVSLSAISRRVEFDTEVEWRESHQFLVSAQDRYEAIVRHYTMLSITDSFGHFLVEPINRKWSSTGISLAIT
jgi:hypothetical protein